MSQGLGNSFDRAQRAYDNQSPPDDDESLECSDCDGMGSIKDGGVCPACEGEGYVLPKTNEPDIDGCDEGD